MSDQRTLSQGLSVFPQDPAGEAKPALCLGVRLSPSGNQSLLIADDVDIDVYGLPGSTARQIVSRFSGRDTAAVIAEAVGVPVATVTAVAARLMEAGVVADLRDGRDPDLTPDVFIALCQRLFQTWKARLFSHRLWRSLNSGEATPSQFKGWLLESYHFAEGVNLRLPLAIAECRQREIRDLLSQHYVEEFDHERFFLAALGEVGVGPQIVEAARPLPGTHAILNHMRDCARQDPLQYAVCGGFLEATGSDRVSGQAFFANLNRHYAPENPNVIQPLADHAALDDVYGHRGLLAAICHCIPHLPQQRASAALGACALFVETLEMWSTDILTTYAEAGFMPDANPRRYRGPAASAQSRRRETEGAVA